MSQSDPPDYEEIYDPKSTARIGRTSQGLVIGVTNNHADGSPDTDTLNEIWKHVKNLHGNAG